ncbi:toxic protein SymE [Lachnotalea glycerini]|uniref:Toxic protein SymE n=1 Tax=Lachnotalea glycerini TaxID=1763509 RepID=A0A318EKG1_9FIRM|nr:SymE family type I addiction module toxin [Lachnotalea glycerini]PXV86921.1 toxic protein SymE [Lachnotalea glycerini]
MDTNRKMKVYQSYNPQNQPMPEIRLKGKWLEESGFGIGQHIEVEIHNNTLIVKQRVIEEKT